MKTRKADYMTLVNGSAQTISYNTWTKINLNTVLDSSGAMVYNASQNSIVVPRAGRYRVWATGTVTYSGLPSVTNVTSLRIYRSGTPEIERFVPQNYRGWAGNSAGSLLVDCATNDYLQIYLYHCEDALTADTLNSAQYRTRLSAEYIGPITQY